MELLFLIPFAGLLMLMVAGAFGWAVNDYILQLP